MEKGWHETPLTMPGDPHVSAARAAEPGRGRDARGPDEIPFLGWRDIFWRHRGDTGRSRIGDLR